MVGMTRIDLIHLEGNLLLDGFMLIFITEGRLDQVGISIKIVHLILRITNDGLPIVFVNYLV